MRVWDNERLIFKKINPNIMSFLNFFEKDPVKEYNKLLEDAERQRGRVDQEGAAIKSYDKAIKLIPTKVEARNLKGEMIFNDVINEMRLFNQWGFLPIMLNMGGPSNIYEGGERKITRSNGKI